MDKCSSMIRNKRKYQSYFDKNLKDYIYLKIKFYLICIFSLGIAYPWALCMEYKAKSHHTVICGKRLRFIGDARELIIHWLWWWFLTVMTLGLYIPVVSIRMDQWITANTVFEETELL